MEIPNLEAKRIAIKPTGQRRAEVRRNSAGGSDLKRSRFEQTNSYPMRLGGFVRVGREIPWAGVEQKTSSRSDDGLPPQIHGGAIAF